MSLIFGSIIRLFLRRHLASHRNQTFLNTIAIVIAFLVSGCDTYKKDEDYVLGDIKSYTGKCFLKVGKDTVFVGVPQCIRSRGAASKSFVSVWVVAPEYSIAIIKEPKNNAARCYWLDVISDSLLKEYGHHLTSGVSYFLLTGSGRFADYMGLYGHMGAYKRAILVERVSQVRRIDGNRASLVSEHCKDIYN